MDPRASELRTGYATIAAAYAEHLSDELAGKPLDRAMLDAFASEVRGPVSDVGCGPGQVAAYLHARGVAVEGVDLSPEMVAQAQRRHPAIAFRTADMFQLPYAAGALAGAVGFYAIVHTPTSELAAPLGELHRVLAPRGLLLLAFHIGEEAKHVDELWGHTTSLDFWFHPAEAVAAALVTAGFTIEARLERAPHPDVEYPSRRCYLLARRG